MAITDIFLLTWIVVVIFYADIMSSFNIYLTISAGFSILILKESIYV